MNKLTLCLLCLVFPLLARAQDVPDVADSEEIRRYTVEVIIFRYVEDVGSGSEVFLPDAPEEPGTEDALDALDEISAGSELAVEPEAETEPFPDIELVLLDEESYQLDNAYERLERLDAYEPLMHFGWTQATWPEEQTEAIPLHLFARPPEDLDGSLTLYLGRYLHLVVDLQLRAPQDASDNAAPAPGYDAFATRGDIALDIGAPPVYYRISEDRILRNGEIRYYDHPKFGLLARVTRVEEEEQPEQGELLGYPVQ